jgi:CubicO group peptidase (beta-lactamase class C family)
MTCLAGLLVLSLSAYPLLLIPQGQSATAPPNIAENIYKVQSNLIQNQVTGSNVVLVVKNGKTIYHEVVNSGKQGDRDIKEDTIFPIWSMSKPITIVAMMTLHEQGLFDWSDPVSEYLPCFENLTVREGEGVRDAKKPLLIEIGRAHV